MVLNSITDTKLDNDNCILGAIPNLVNSKIIIPDNAHGNILYCEEGVTLENSTITFCGNNSIVFLGKSRYIYKINVYINNNCVCSIGRNNYFNGVMRIVVSEHKHVFVGSDSVFSMGILIRNSDAHLIYDVYSKKRLNPTKSVFIGDHVWLGEDVKIFKGTRISSGAILGACSVIANKKVRHNSSNAGNPCKEIKTDIFWDGACVHAWDEDKTKQSEEYDDFLSTFTSDFDIEKYVFEVNKDTHDANKVIDKVLSIEDSALKIDKIIAIYDDTDKNRFSSL